MAREKIHVMTIAPRTARASARNVRLSRLPVAPRSTARTMLAISRKQLRKSLKRIGVPIVFCPCLLTHWALGSVYTPIVNIASLARGHYRGVVNMLRGGPSGKVVGRLRQTLQYRPDRGGATEPLRQLIPDVPRREVRKHQRVC